MISMKTLLIGFYDYSYHASAYVLEDNKLTSLELVDYEIFDAINSYAHHYASEEEIETCNKLFSQYDQVLLCEDGCYTLLK